MTLRMDSKLSTPEYFLRKSPADRIAIFTRYGREELDDMRKKIKNEDSRQRFEWAKTRWFERLRRYMREYKISKDTLREYGVDYSECVKYFYAN